MTTVLDMRIVSADLDQLLPKVALGDRSALKAIYDAAAPRLFAILMRTVRRRELAEDLLQETFVTIWRKAYQFDARRGEASAWMSAIARRKAIDRLRVAAREITGLDAVIESLADRPESRQGGVDAETRITLNTQRRLLKPDLNRAIELCYGLGLTHEELAEELKIPLGTAKSWVRRGLTQLKDALTTPERRYDESRYDPGRALRPRCR